MSADTIKRLAADIFGVGKNRIRIKAGEKARALEALTREDVRGLISDGAVYKERYVGPRTKPPRKNKGRGKRKGKKYSRKGEKEAWMERIRSQRKYLAELLESGEVAKEDKRRIYLKIKGGAFRGKKALRIYLNENGMLKEGAKAEAGAPPKAAAKKKAPAVKKPAAKGRGEPAVRKGANAPKAKPKEEEK
jgi:large subunit ribosomal protein L19e